jgi:uncharacterized protein YqjF (DUF2071 family)
MDYVTQEGRPAVILTREFRTLDSKELGVIVLVKQASHDEVFWLNQKLERQGEVFLKEVYERV